MPDDTDTAPRGHRDQSSIEILLRRMVADDATVAAEILDRAATTTSPQLLVAAAMLTDQPRDVLTSASRLATTSRDRQLVEVATAHLAGNEDLFDALVRDHLVDHPDDILAAWIAAQHIVCGRPAPLTPTARAALPQATKEHR